MVPEEQGSGQESHCQWCRRRGCSDAVGEGRSALPLLPNHAVDGSKADLKDLSEGSCQWELRKERRWRTRRRRCLSFSEPERLEHDSLGTQEKCY